MEGVAESMSTQAGDVSPADNFKFDPSDYLPRRTSRASAHTASKAIKKSVAEGKVSPSKQVTTSTETDEKQSISGSSKCKNTGTVKIARFPKQHHSPYNCFVRLVRLENDPLLKDFVKSLKTQKISSTSDNLKSKYQVVYAPTFASEKKGLSQISANGVKFLQKGTYIKKDENSDHEKEPSSSTSARPGPSVVRGKAESSLNLVVVHPKPGSKIINTGKGKESKSALLHQMISDPKMVISNKISRVMTTAGNAELGCNKCSKTFAAARDLINHKRLAHKTSGLMCRACAQEFPTQEAHDCHTCKARFRCDICGVCCKKAGNLATHRKMAHGKTLGEYMCYVCCFNASTQEELNDHCCGGKPKIVYSAQASSSVMVYPKWSDTPRPGGSAPQPNIYIDLTAPKQDNSMSGVMNMGPSSSKGQYLCEVCLNMFSSTEALAAHTCNNASMMDAGLMGASVPASGSVMEPVPMPPPVMPVGMEVLPEVAELAKFYSSVVFGK